MTLDLNPPLPAFKSRVSGQFFGEGLLDDTVFGTYLKDSCGGAGFQTTQFGVAYPRDQIFFASSWIVSPEDVWNEGNPLWLEMRPAGSDEILICCQWTI